LDHEGIAVAQRFSQILSPDAPPAFEKSRIAEPGGICISDAPYQQVRDELAIDFEDIGERQLKNIACPVRV
jgi:adenylate cyclase